MVNWDGRFDQPLRVRKDDEDECNLIRGSWFFINTLKRGVPRRRSIAETMGDRPPWGKWNKVGLGDD